VRKLLQSLNTVKDAALPLINDETPDTGMPVSAPPAPTRARRRLVGLEATQRKQKRVRYVLLAVSAAFMINALVGDNGFLATIKARRQYAAIERQVNALRVDNQRMLKEAERLKSDPSAIEDAARKDLGLIRPGETLVIIKDAQPAK